MPRPKKPHLKRRPDGRYRCKYKNQYFYGSTPDEAIARRDEYKRREADGITQRKTGVKVCDYVPTWLQLHKSNVSPKCLSDYKKQLAVLVSVIGQFRLSDVTVDDASRVWSHYSSYSSSTIKRARMLFIALFDSAIENDLCRKNPFRAHYAQPPKGYSGTHRALSPDEIALINSTPHHVQLAALIMLYCGLRRGEVLALTKKDIDLEANVVIVNKAIRFVGNKPIIVAPKTVSGVRRVPILPNIRPLLENAPEAVLSAKKGGLMTSTAFRCAWASYLHALSLAAGHPVSIRPHDLRHTYCTMLMSAGVSLKQAMAWLGHADEQMILRVYDHVTQQRTTDSIESLKTFVSGSNWGSTAPPPSPVTLIQQQPPPITAPPSDSEGHAFESHRAYHTPTPKP